MVCGQIRTLSVTPGIVANALRAFKVGLQLPTSAVFPIVAPLDEPSTTTDLGSFGGCDGCPRNLLLMGAWDRNVNLAHDA
jgi:hypothetical protein